MSNDDVKKQMSLSIIRSSEIKLVMFTALKHTDGGGGRRLLGVILFLFGLSTLRKFLNLNVKLNS